MIEMQLSEELIRQIEATQGSLDLDSSAGDTIKCAFDGKGTLHIQNRREDGSLKKDVAVKPSNEKYTMPNINDELMKELQVSQTKTAGATKRTNIVLGLMLVLLTALTGLTIYVCNYLAYIR